MKISKIETKRLILRKFTENDIKAVFDIYSDEEVNKFLPWFLLSLLMRQKSFIMKNMQRIMKKIQATDMQFALKMTIYQLDM